MDLCNFTTNTTEVVRGPEKGLEIFYVMIIVLSVFSIFGNGVIIVTILTSSKFRRPSNYLTGNLSTASALCSVSVIFRCMEHEHGLWKYSPLTCFTLGTLHRVPHDTEAFTMMQLSLDRTRLARTRFRRETSMMAGRKTLVIWVVSLLIDIPRGFYHEYNEAMRSNYKCTKGILLNNKHLHLAYFFLHLTLTLILPISFLIQEFWTLRRKLNYLHMSMKQDQNMPSIYRRVHILKGTFVLTGIFLLFYVPQCCIQVAFELPKEIWSEEVHQYLYLGRYTYYILITIHSNCYPVLIFIISSELRKKLLCPMQDTNRF